MDEKDLVKKVLASRNNHFRKFPVDFKPLSMYKNSPYTRLSNQRKIDGASSKFWACRALYKYLPKQNESNYESDESELHFEDVYWPQNWFVKNSYTCKYAFLIIFQLLVNWFLNHQCSNYSGIWSKDIKKYIDSTVFQSK